MAPTQGAWRNTPFVQAARIASARRKARARNRRGRLTSHLPPPSTARRKGGCEARRGEPPRPLGTPRDLSAPFKRLGFLQGHAPQVPHDARQVPPDPSGTYEIWAGKRRPLENRSIFGFPKTLSQFANLEVTQALLAPQKNGR